jgi:hypothetical protein
MRWLSPVEGIYYDRRLQQRPCARDEIIAFRLSEESLERAAEVQRLTRYHNKKEAGLSPGLQILIVL